MTVQELEISTAHAEMPDDECGVTVTYERYASCDKSGVRLHDGSNDAVSLNWAEWDATVAAVAEIRRIAHEVEVGRDT